MKITGDYIIEKIEAYNVAIEALRSHEPGSDGDHELAYKLRKRLADKLDRELDRWYAGLSDEQCALRSKYEALNND